MPDINHAFPSKYLKASDLNGREATVTIDKVDFEAVGNDREMKPVLFFIGKQKGLVCNKTNAKKIIAIAGSSLTEDWSGVAITLYPTETEFGGETVDCIRVKAIARTAPRIPVTPKPSGGGDSRPLTVDDIPF